MGERVARALSAVHAAGIVHRDIKAQNVMRAEGGRIVLMDFGSSREERDDSQSQSGITGTPLYMAPELFEDAPASVASDVYAVGVLLFYLATGSFPVTATSFSRLAQAHAQGERRSLLELRADLPAEFVAVVETALSADPDQRFASAAQMAEALARSRGATGLAHPPAPLRRIGRRAWAAAAVVVLGAAAWSLLGRGPAPPPVEFEVEAALLRYHEDSTEELFSGAQLAVEQDLGLRLTTDAAVHLYVIDQDAAGNTFVLFPLRGGEVQNPLPAGTHELPGRLDGEDVAWTVTSEGGQEQILLVASREPLTGLEARIADVARAGESSPYARVDAPVLEGLRGIGGLSARPPTGEITKSQPILEEIEELVGSSGRSSGQKSREGVWIRRIVLRSGGS